MLAKRIILCLDIKEGKTVKGINFVNFRDAGDPVELGAAYSRAGADELVYLDITASHEGRKTFTELVKKVAANISIPFTVGGGINELQDVDRLLGAGADKVSVNSAAIANPDLIKEAADEFGVQCVVVAIDAKKRASGGYDVYVKGGRENTGIDLIEWVKKCQELGAGEILLTSMDRDGTRDGFDIDMLNALMRVVSIPVIASGGCGGQEDIVEVFEKTNCDGALAASLFHYQEATIEDVKALCAKHHIPVRREL